MGEWVVRVRTGGLKGLGFGGSGLLPFRGIDGEESEWQEYPGSLMIALAS